MANQRMRWNLELNEEEAAGGSEDVIELDTGKPGVASSSSSNNNSPWLDSLQYGEYRADEGGKYEWHTDTGKTKPMRKLSFTLQLSDAEDYSGGELQFERGIVPGACPKVKGTVCIFPSFFRHRVTEVTRGTRKSVVGWMSGGKPFPFSNPWKVGFPFPTAGQK